MTKGKQFFLVLLLVIGTAAGSLTVSAVAGNPIHFWHQEGLNYRCAGAPAYVICHSIPRSNRVDAYRVMIDRQHFWVAYRGHLIYECWPQRNVTECREIP